MTRGRKAQPTAIKKLRGFPGKRAVNAAEPQFDVGIPPVPGHLDEVALMEWNRIVNELALNQVITQVDMSILAVYCQTYGEWLALSMRAEKEERYLSTESGYKYKNPIFSDIAKLRRELQSYAAELGITPSSRTRVRTVGKKQEREDEKRERIMRLFEVETH